jgi:hypothetical protein
MDTKLAPAPDLEPDPDLSHIFLSPHSHKSNSQIKLKREQQTNNKQ